MEGSSKHCNDLNLETLEKQYKPVYIIASNLIEIRIKYLQSVTTNPHLLGHRIESPS
jgi:hypothetical protein